MGDVRGARVAAATGGEEDSTRPTAQSSPIFWDLSFGMLHAGRLIFGQPLNALPHEKKRGFLAEQGQPGSPAVQDAACLCKLLPNGNN